MDLTGARWRKSSYSGNSGGDRVEVAAVAAEQAAPHAIAVRDSKDPDGPKLIVTPAQWHIFATAVRAGEFDLD